MTLSAATFAFWYYAAGSHIFPDVLLNDIAGPDGDPLLLSLKLAVDVLVSNLMFSCVSYQLMALFNCLIVRVVFLLNHLLAKIVVHHVISCPCALGLATPRAILVGTSLGARQGLLIRGGDVLERLASVDHVAFDKTGTFTEGKPTVSSVASFSYDESEILQIAAAVERTIKAKPSDLMNLERAIMHQSSSPSNYSKRAVYVGHEGDGVIGAIGISDTLRSDAESIVPSNYSKRAVYVGHEGDGVIGAIGISDTLRSDAESIAVATIAKTVGIGNEFVSSSLTPQQKSTVISTLKTAGHRIAMVGNGINDAPSLALADVGISLQTEAQGTAASDAASIILVGNKLSQNSSPILCF
ncbi:hypothetical protein DITRI_Ditri03aG0033800 [Diplodiscus trichospermus]